MAPTQHDLNCLSISELEAIARERMDKQTRDYYNEGADAGSTLAENARAYSKYRIRPRVLRDISRIDTSASIFNFRNAIPLGVAPAAMQRLAHTDGELATARACAKAGIAMGLSSFATETLEDVAAAARAAAAEAGKEDIPLCLQLYLFEDREHSRRLIARAKRAGYKAVFLTVDTPMLGRRNLEIRNQFQLPGHLRIANFEDGANDDVVVGAGGETEEKVRKAEREEEEEEQERKDAYGGDSVAGYLDERTGKRVLPRGPVRFHTHAANPTLTWDRDVAWLREECGREMQVWVKGIATAEDAALAVAHGVDGVVVSNHGGRQLDGALATLDALPEVVEAVGGRVPVHVDGGVRRGTDVFKALALGADFVWIGRPVLWGLAYKGQEGVELCLRLLADEVRLCMGLAGTLSVKDISKDYLVEVDRDGFVRRLPTSKL